MGKRPLMLSKVHVKVRASNLAAIVKPTTDKVIIHLSAAEGATTKIALLDGRRAKTAAGRGHEGP